jgi:sterol desaturase/sphingolipid hydroxylase (fatty acid hydroxylase superfamily)
MTEWAITLLEIIAVVTAFLAMSILILMFIVFAKYLLRRVQFTIPKIPKKEQTKRKRRTENMSKEAREGVTFNDIFMFMIAVPLVLLWVGFAGYVIFHGLQDATVLNQIEGYTTLIAILGGPALLIIKDALDVWKQEQAEKTAFYKIKAQAVIDYNDKAQEQAQMIEAKQQEHSHKLEKK